MFVYRWIMWILTWLSADPGQIERERPRASACVAVARASLLAERPAPSPDVAECVCGGTCKNGVWKPDGRIEQPCPCPKTCKCKGGTGSVVACPDGRCPAPGASPTVGSPARP